MNGIIKNAPSIMTPIAKRAVTTVRHSAISSRMLMVVPIEKTSRITDHLAIWSKPAFLIISGGIQPAIKAIKKSIKLTKTAETLALVTTPRKSPIPKNKRQIKRYQYIEVNIVLVRS